MADADSAAARDSASYFRAGRAIARTFSVWIRTLPQLLLITALVHGPILALNLWLRESEATSYWHVVVLGLLPALSMTVGSRLAEGLIVSLVFRRLRGDPAAPARSMAEGIRRFGSIGVIAVVTGLFILTPSILQYSVLGPEWRGGAKGQQFNQIGTVVVFLLYALVFCVAIPAALVERRGPISAFRRSRLLTAGHRAALFWVWLVVGFLIQSPCVLMLKWFLGRTFDPSIGYTAIAIVTWLLGSLTCVLPIVLYHELRETKEGIGIEELLEVFD